MQSEALSTARPNEGRSTEAIADARRLEVLRLYSECAPRQEILDYVQGLGFSFHTAQQDMTWARRAWREMEDQDETVADIIRHHKERYYQLVSKARQQGDIRLEADMLGRVEKLLGLHGPKVAVQINHNTAVTNVAVTYDLSRLGADQLDQLRYLLEEAKAAPDADA